MITLTQKLLQAAITAHTLTRKHARRSNEIKSSHHRKRDGLSLRLIVLFFLLSLAHLRFSCTVCFHLKCNYSSWCSKLNSTESLSHRSCMLRCVEKMRLHLTVSYDSSEIRKLFSKLPVVLVLFLVCRISSRKSTHRQCKRKYLNYTADIWWRASDTLREREEKRFVLQHLKCGRHQERKMFIGWFIWCKDR